jgi:hypothetical protein
MFLKVEDGSCVARLAQPKAGLTAVSVSWYVSNGIEVERSASGLASPAWRSYFGQIVC